MAILDLVRKNIVSLKPYSSARDEFSGKGEVFLDANENPSGQYNRYPDPHHRDLRQRISQLKNMPAEQIFLGNGSDEVIDLVYRIFCEPGKHKVLLFPPTYGMYEVSAAVNDVEVVRCPLNDQFQVDLPAMKQAIQDELIRVAIICSPNNPTGNDMEEDAVLELLRSFSGIVLMDEAYIDFSHRPSWTGRLSDFPRLIVMQTFSKAWGLASVRMGMAFASEEITEIFRKVKPPYNISGPNQQIVLGRLNDVESVQSDIQIILEEREGLRAALECISSVKKVFPSDSNFILVEIEDANRLYDYLVERGVIVRNRSSILRDALRITVGTRSENERLIQTIQDFYR